MSIVENKALARRAMQEVDRGSLDGVTSLCAPDCRFHGWAPQTLDISGYKQAMTELLEAFSDTHFPVDDLIAEDDMVAVRHRFQGIHSAEFQGVVASSEAVEVGGIVIFHIVNGAIVEAWLNADFLGILQQIGAIPAPA